MLAVELALPLLLAASSNSNSFRWWFEDKAEMGEIDYGSYSQDANHHYPHSHPHSHP